MSSFLFYTIIFITISVPVGIIIFDFFDIRFEVYGNYLLWFIAMAIFNAILPYEQISIFDDDILSKVKKGISNITTPASASASGAMPTAVAVFEQNIVNNPEGKTISDSGMNLKTTTAALPRNVSTTTTNNNNNPFANLKKSDKPKKSDKSQNKAYNTNGDRMVNTGLRSLNNYSKGSSIFNTRGLFGLFK